MPRFRVPLHGVAGQRNHDPRFVAPLVIGDKHIAEFKTLNAAYNSLKQELTNERSTSNRRKKEINTTHQKLKKILGDDWEQSISKLKSCKETSDKLKQEKEDNESNRNKLNTMSNNLVSLRKTVLGDDDTQNKDDTSDEGDIAVSMVVEENLSDGERTDEEEVDNSGEELTLGGEQYIAQSAEINVESVMRNYYSSNILNSRLWRERDSMIENFNELFEDLDTKLYDLYDENDVAYLYHKYTTGYPSYNLNYETSKYYQLHNLYQALLQANQDNYDKAYDNVINFFKSVLGIEKIDVSSDKAKNTESLPRPDTKREYFNKADEEKISKFIEDEKNGFLSEIRRLQQEQMSPKESMLAVYKYVYVMQKHLYSFLKLDEESPPNITEMFHTGADSQAVKNSLFIYKEWLKNFVEAFKKFYQCREKQCFDKELQILQIIMREVTESQDYDNLISSETATRGENSFAVTQRDEDGNVTGKRRSKRETDDSFLKSATFNPPPSVGVGYEYKPLQRLVLPTLHKLGRLKI